MAPEPRVSARSDRRHGRIDALAPWATGLLLAVPVIVAFYPPMTDLPFHEAAVGILRHFDDTSMFPPRLYRLNLGEPNQLFHMMGWALAYVAPTRWAVKLAVAATVVAVPVCGARFARHVGASPLAAVVVAPMALGWLFSWGLVANLVGLAALLASLPALDRYAGKPTASGASATFAAIVLLYSAHEAMMFVYAVMAVVLAAVSPWSLRGIAARLAPVLAIAGVHGAHTKWVKQFMTPSVQAVPIIWHSLGHKLGRVPSIVLPATEDLARMAMFALCGLAIGSSFWLRTRERRSGASDVASRMPPDASRVEALRRICFDHRFEVFAIACFGAYLAFPLTLHGATLVYQRFFPPAYAVLAIVAAPRDLWTRASRVTRMVIAALPFATLLEAGPAFADSDREYRALEALIPLIEPGSAVAEVDLGPGDPSRSYSLGPAAGRILATRGGRLAYAFTDSPISPVVLRRRYQWNESLIRIAFDSWAFRPKHDFRRFRYVLLRTTDPRLTWMATFALKREAEYLSESGEWILFRSSSPVAALTSPDVRLEDPPPESVRDLVNGVVTSLNKSPDVQVPAEPKPDDSCLRDNAKL